MITFCDRIREIPRDHGFATTTHWSLPDPSPAGGTDRESYPVFRRVASKIDTRIAFLPL